MKKELIQPSKPAWVLMKKIIVSAAIIPGLAFSSFGMAIVPVAHAIVIEDGVCLPGTTETLTLMSNDSGDDATQTAGFTTVEPADPLSAASYEGALVDADDTTAVIPPWVDPAVEADLSGASWISTDASNNEGVATDNQWRLFEDTLTLPAGAIIESADLWYTADNAVAVYLNGSEEDTTGDVFGPTPDPAEPLNFAQVFDTSFNPADLVAGDNTINFVVRNWSGQSDSNPTGLIYKAVVDYCIPPAPENVTVTIAKYIDGEAATEGAADGADFPMSATWSDLADGGIGAGSGEYALSETGFNNPNPYEATTAEMQPGADYSTNEILTGSVVGASCEDGKPFALVGYTTGETMEEAEGGEPSLTIPALTDIQSDQYVIVWNEACADTNPDTGTLTVIKHVIGGPMIADDMVLAVKSGEETLYYNDASETGWSVEIADGTSYWVSEAIYDGYEMTQSEGCTGVMGADDNIECVVTNTYTDEPSEPSECLIVSDTTNTVEGDGDAVATYDDNSAWTAAISGATWIWSDEFVQEPVAGETQTFLKSFNLSGAVTDATLEIAADNSYVVYINDVQVGADLAEDNFSSVDTVINITDDLVSGVNTLKFVVTNMPEVDGTAQSNPAGLLYKLDIDGGVCATVPDDGGNDDDEITVTIHKFVQGAMATAVSADNADFPMSATWNEIGDGGIGAGTGEYVLSETNSPAYEAETIDFNPGSSYSTNEVLTGPIVGASCDEEKPYALLGYKTGDTMAEALAAPMSLTVPSFVNLQGDKHVIVYNTDCAIEGEVDAELMVVSVEPIDTSTNADGTFADGWKYIFHITAPSTEQDLAMKFSDWLRTGGGGTIPVANNMRISSAQADNGGATILLTAADTYSTPALHMTGDLNPVMAGRQVDITVEVAVPVGTPSGSYTTNYGVMSN